jgi:hypothetical protein
MSSESLKDTTAMPVQGKPPSKVTVTWAGDHRFDGQRQSGGPSIRMDASAETGPSPVDTLLCALAGCTGVDVVDILAKRRSGAHSCRACDRVGGDEVLQRAGQPRQAHAGDVEFGVEWGMRAPADEHDA